MLVPAQVVQVIAVRHRRKGPGVDYYVLESLVDGQWLGIQVTGQITSSLTSVSVKLQPATSYTFAVVAGNPDGSTSPRSPLTTFSTPPRDTVLSCAIAFSPITFNGGFLANLRLVNTSSYIVNGWVLRFRFPGDQQITPNTTFYGTATQVGQDVTVVNASFDANIDAFGQLNIGFRGTYTGTFTSPAAFTVNDISCSPL